MTDKPFSYTQRKLARKIFKGILSFSNLDVFVCNLHLKLHFFVFQVNIKSFKLFKYKDINQNLDVDSKRI